MLSGWQSSGIRPKPTGWSQSILMGTRGKAPSRVFLCCEKALSIFMEPQKKLFRRKIHIFTSFSGEAAPSSGLDYNNVEIFVKGRNHASTQTGYLGSAPCWRSGDCRPCCTGGRHFLHQRPGGV